MGQIYKRLLGKLKKSTFFPIYYMFYEMFHEHYVIITASIKPDKHNWGDDMSKVLAHFINPNIKFIPSVYTWNIKKKNNVLVIGSIISWMTNSKSIIWGSGVVYPNQIIPAKPIKVCAVRGPLSRKYLLAQGISCPEIYGDPALLFPKFYSPQISKRYKLGIIPHFRDQSNSLLDKYRNNENVLIINVRDILPWHKFIDQICSCDCICSSSLHGIIISDAYNIPNCWIEFLGGERKRYAFHDYLQSVGRTEKEGTLLNEQVTVEDLIGITKFWKPIQIDLQKLMDVCPFK